MTDKEKQMKPKKNWKIQEKIDNANTRNTKCQNRN